ncbi:glucosyl/glucuronosyl transferases, putative [Ricinus communis]|uniref:Glycosyltransferase n=1 Tax=Ricinus communis TaxID=3988 RepID=B9SAL6_RICCO|nr:glucosyl/glucuronosyl transferases, putative [Ricinus communis]
MERMHKRSISSVLMFPWLAHGHISPFLELAKKLAKRNFYVYLCSTPVNLDSIKQNLSPKYLLSIQLVELHLPSLPDLPSHCHTTKGLPPHLMTTLKTAFDMATPNFSNILETLRPDLLIYDFLQPWAAALALSFDIPAVLFLCSSMAMSTFCRHFSENSSDDHFPFPEIYPKWCLDKKVLEVLESSSNERKDKHRVNQCIERSYHLILAKTFRELEGKYIDYLSVKLMKKIVPVGPLVQEDNIPIHEDEKMEVIQWLEKKEPSSAVFVSFGSEYFLSSEEREEIANGLELSKVNFIWVVRFPAGEEIKLEDALPKGYIERVKEKGLIVEGWLPQAKMLGHSSIGGFVSHCGWSSIMESMKFGVPVIAMPMNLDQPLNARVVEEAGVGIEVNRNIKSGEGLDREEIAKTIRKVVLEKVVKM